MDKTMNSHNERGKYEKFLKTILKMILTAQNMRFSRWNESQTSCQVKLPKTHVTNFEKFV